MSIETRDKLVEDLRLVLHDAELLTKETANDLTGKAKELRDKLAVRVSQAKEQLADLDVVVKDKALQGARETDRVIREHPYESLGIAFGVGILVGVLLNRK
ncbi:MAG: YqjD family protein [Candidatus Methylacidiphilales bacterium]